MDAVDAVVEGGHHSVESPVGGGFFFRRFFFKLTQHDTLFRGNTLVLQFWSKISAHFSEAV